MMGSGRTGSGEPECWNTQLVLGEGSDELPEAEDPYRFTLLFKRA